MCGNCGCNTVEKPVEIHTHAHDHNHGDHDHHHPHDHDHHHGHNGSHHHSHSIDINQSIFAKNDRFAERNRGYFLAKDLFVINVVSSPGSGKTALLERTIEQLKNKLNLAIIVGDLETDNDAQRLRKNDIPVVQITTGTLCHLDAEMVLNAAQKISLNNADLLIIENVGNLVCPAAYDLGEHKRIVLLSTTEGEDKPLKYPTMFKSADVVIVNKIDIAEVVGFDRNLALKNIQKMCPQAAIFELSARTGEGMEDWLNYLQSQYQTIVGRSKLTA
ncbi:hydrogenase nickel incorporation protein HypB [Synechococcus moorigangaii CMS01]|nr:hydrogenase nickel incorporation protein HypB [Synechococcus moorigangaii CMS01]